TGNGIAVYRFHRGTVTPERFIYIAPQPLAAGKFRASAMREAPRETTVPFPAGLAVLPAPAGEQLLVAANLADTVLQLAAATGKIARKFGLRTDAHIPAAYPYAVVANRAGTRAWVSLWNASAVAELDLQEGIVARRIPLREPPSPTQAGSHPTALLLSPDERLLYVALANTDEVAVLSTDDGMPLVFLSTRSPDQKYQGAYPIALAQGADGRRLFVANAGIDAVAVFDTSGIFNPGSPSATLRARVATGFVPTEWHPTALAVEGNSLLIVSGKSQGTGANSATIDYPEWNNHPFIAAMLHGSIARVNIEDAEKHLAALTSEVEESNLMNGRIGSLPFKSGSNPIKHVIYVIKENRSYDQVFGDLGVGDGDPSLTMYGEAITPNQHKLARQFGVLDNFYDSGEVSGDGHVWSTAAITSDYNEKTWPITYRGRERTYDYEGMVADEYPLEHGIPNVDSPQTGYLWANALVHGLTYRDYGEFISTEFCVEPREPGQPASKETLSPSETAPGGVCEHKVVKYGEPLPSATDAKGKASPYAWEIPNMKRSVPTMAELREHSDLRFASFNVDYPDQLRADEFLHEFDGFVKTRAPGTGDELPNLVIMHLPNDHTGGTRPGKSTPAASVADNDLALGRIVDAVSHSPYWDDTAILVLE